ncbi:MAG: hypothetical protein RMZ43_036025, partial [Nostoc sp. CmiVER01]|uniref:hypothetical protein n=1 Tax=Nostoc sp. CmiVER01 TaxID=3075384 RepID=UPI003D160F19
MASIEVWLHRRPDRSVPMADMYAQDIARLSLVDGPLGFRQAGPPPMLVDTGDYVVEVYNAKIPVRGLKC